MFELTFYDGATAHEWTDKVISLGRLVRKAEEEGRMPRILYFDNFDVEVPLHQTGGLFGLSVLAAYPDYRLTLSIHGRTVFRGQVDFESIAFTAAETVRFSVVSFLATLDRVRWPAAWIQRDLIADWNDLGIGATSQVNVLPRDQISGGDFYEYIYVSPLPTWKTHNPMRVGDFIVHPGWPEIIYQVRELSIEQPGAIPWHKIVLDRPWFDPTYVPGAAGPVYSSAVYRLREFLGQEVFEHPTWSGGGLPPIGDGFYLNGRNVGKALFSHLDITDIDTYFLGDPDVFPPFMPIDAGGGIAKEDNPVRVLNLLLGFQRQAITTSSSGTLRTVRIGTGAHTPEGLYPEIPEGAVLDSAVNFSWDKRVDRVEVSASWRGETVEAVSERAVEGSTDARRQTLRVEIIGDADRAEQVAADLFSFYGYRRYAARVRVPADTLLAHASDPLHVLDADLYVPVRYKGLGWQISGIEIDVSALAVTLELTGLQAFDPEAG